MERNNKEAVNLLPLLSKITCTEDECGLGLVDIFLKSGRRPSSYYFIV